MTKTRGALFMIRTVFLCTIILFSFLHFGCRKDDGPCTTCPPTYVPSIFLDTLSVDVTEVLLRVRLTDTSGTARLALYRDSLLVFSGQPLRGDTTVSDTGLAPAHQYDYKAYRLSDSRHTDSTTLLTLRTLDTTSHNFTFQIDTLGDGSSSVLYDVAIINDTLAYAVGEIYLRDSLGNWDPNAYNLAKWNGQHWELMRMQFYTICGQASRTPYPAKAIFAFSSNDIWIAMDGDQVARWNGTTQTATTCLPTSFAINKLWGENSNSVYAVGEGGNIMHYSSGTWQRVESGTTLPIWDIFGATNSRTGEYEIICVASNHSFPEGRKLLRIKGSSVVALPDSGLPWSIDAIWHVPGRKYIVVGDSVWNVNCLGSIWTSIRGLPNLYTTSIAGSALNDIIIGGAFWNLLHFNGIAWRSYFPFISGALGGVAIKGNLVIASGYIGNRAVVLQGRR